MRSRHRSVASAPATSPATQPAAALDSATSPPAKRPAPPHALAGEPGGLDPVGEERLPAERLLDAIKHLAPVDTRVLADRLGLSSEAVRQQLARLAAQGLVHGALLPPAGVGRPRQVWALTSAGHARYPNAHAQLAVQLIDQVRTLFGEHGLDQLVNAREQQQRERYQTAAAVPDLPGKLAALARLRSDEGYMAQVQQRGDALLFIEDHCPICAAAAACQGFCRSELALFQEVLGDQATIVRDEYILDGGKRCSYRVIPIATRA